MSNKGKIIVWTGLILIPICLALLLVLRSLCFVAPMKNDTMTPLIASNDIVIAAKWYRTASLHNGDLVVARVPTPAGEVLTVRKIELQTNTPPGQFYLRAVNTDGLDSRWFGPIPAGDIIGKVVWVIK